MTLCSSVHGVKCNETVVKKDLWMLYICVMSHLWGKLKNLSWHCSGLTTSCIRMEKTQAADHVCQETKTLECENIYSIPGCTTDAMHIKAPVCELSTIYTQVRQCQTQHNALKFVWSPEGRGIPLLKVVVWSVSGVIWSNNTCILFCQW